MGQVTESEQNVWFGLKKFIYIVGLSTMATVGLVGLQLKKYQFSRRCQRIYAVCSCVYLRKCTGPSCVYSSSSLRSVWSELVVCVSSVSGQWSAFSTEKQQLLCSRESNYKDLVIILFKTVNWPQIYILGNHRIIKYFIVN